MCSRFTLRFLLLLFTVAATPLYKPAAAQSGTTQPIPFSNAIAGIASGSANALCSTSIPNTGGVSTGDGCLPTQATLTALYDAAVDAEGNVYISESGTNIDVRVVYNGGSVLTAMLIASNQSVSNFAPVQGRIYTLAGGLQAAIASKSSVYTCASGSLAQNGIGDGCPATQTFIKPRGIAVDANGNVFFVDQNSSTGSFNSVHVIYAGGAQVAKLIATEVPGTTAQVGHLYILAGSGTGYSGDGGLARLATFATMRYLALDQAGDLFISDGTTPSTSGTTTIVAAANNVRRVDANTGIITTVAGETSCTYSATTGCPYGSSGDGGPATSALLNAPYSLFTDRFNNLFISDYTNHKLRVVYAGGVLAGISSPVAGSIYTYAGGGTATANGTVASQVAFGVVQDAGIDSAGNVYVEDSTSHVIWRFDAVTGIGNVIAGASSASAAGVNCAGTSVATGPVSTDKFGDGCPALQSTLSDTGRIAVDAQGNLYTAENTNVVVRKLSYNTQFTATPDGTAVTQPLAFATLGSSATGTLPADSYRLESSTSTRDFAAGGTPTCVLNSSATPTVQLCTFNVNFNPTHPGLRSGAVTITAPNSARTELISGIGLAADVAVDTGTETTLGSGITPAGVAVDLAGRVYVADTVGNRILVGTAGAGSTSLVPLITGLNKPSGLAVDGAGNLYIADTGNNRVLETTSAGVTIGTLGSGLSGPTGVAVDGTGNVYVADAGNNRVLQAFANGNINPVFVAAGLSAPAQLAFDGSGDFYIVDSGNARIVELSLTSGEAIVALDPGVVPTGIAVDAAGTLYVNDSAGKRVLAYPAGISTGTALLTDAVTPVALAADADANLFVADAGKTGLTVLNRSLGSVNFPLTNVGQTTTANFSVNNVGSASLVFPATPFATVTGSSYYSVGSPGASGCAAAASYTSGQSCTLTASFSPQTTGSTSATATLNTNAADNGSVSIQLKGTGLRLTSTTTAISVTSPTGTIQYGQTVSLSAVLTPSAVTTTPSGTFTFSVDGKAQTPQALGAGPGTLAITPAVGTHVVSVTYSGDMVYASSAANTSFTVVPASTATSLTVSSVNTNGTLSTLFTATVSSATASGETGSVNFYAGSVLLGTAKVAGGKATFSSNAVTFAINTFTATYTGDTNFTPSTSPAVVGVTDFAIGSGTSTFTIVQGDVVTVPYLLSPIFGGGGSLSASCTGLPANSVCRFQPVTISLGYASQAVMVEIFTNVSSNLAANENTASRIAYAFALGLPLCLLILAARRRRSVLPTLLAVMVMIGLVFGSSGCGTGTNVATQGNFITPVGTYAVTVVFAGSNGLTTTHSAAVTLTVNKSN